MVELLQESVRSSYVSKIFFGGGRLSTIDSASATD